MKLYKETYDYIIIGAGTAGCVLAARLLQKTTSSVLILEAGIPNHDPVFHISPEYPNVSDFLRYVIRKENVLKVLPSKEPSGRCIYGMIGCIWGGSSTVNGSVFNLPKEVDFQNWASYLEIQLLYSQI